MNKLIKAEFYRILHSGPFFRIFILMGLLPMAATLPEIFFMDEVSLTNLLMIYSQMGMLYMYVGITLSALISNIYFNRTYYYEIMNGANTHHIIISKLIVHNTIAVAVMIIPSIIVYTAIGMKYGVGLMQQPWLTAVLGAIIILNFCNMTTFISMIMRHILGGPITVFVITLIPTMVYMVLPPDTLTGLKDVLSYTPQIQLNEFVQIEYSADFIAKVLISFVVFFVLFYALTYASYKKKNFN